MSNWVVLSMIKWDCISLWGFDWQLDWGARARFASTSFSGDIGGESKGFTAATLKEDF